MLREPSCAKSLVQQTVFTLSSHLPVLYPYTEQVSQQLHSSPHDLDDLHDPLANPLPQRQRYIPTPPSLPRPASSESSSARFLRRTPRLQAISAARGSPLFPRAPYPANVTDRDVSFDQSGSTTPHSFRKLVEEDSYWPQRSTHISRRTHDAILFALEAIRKGRGVDAQPLTADLLEEKARMSDLLRGNQPAGPSTARVQNGGSRPVQGTGGPSEPVRYRTPTEIVAARRAREAKKAAEQESERQRLIQEEQYRRRQQEESAGVEGDQSRRPSGGGRPDTQTGTTYNIGGGNPQTQQTSRRQETISAAPQAQARPSSSQQQGGAGLGHARLSSNTQRNRTDAYDQLNVPAPAPPNARPAAQTSSSNAPQPQAQPQPATQQPRSGFPHAFERWETLSSHWEGLTSYWIRRLQENTNELNGKPIELQISRQITDLSAAGANLFHAVVELQRLRASSERKFQRWFFETRNEQEQATERQAELEGQLRAERETRVQERETRVQGTGSTDAVRAEQARTEETLREMRRELQISKEEARRAWEELGRREQEERERTIALRSGEPTLIGGVQVVPMQGLTSRQTSTVQRPQTRDGPVSGGPGPTSLGGQGSLRPENLPPSRTTTSTSLDSPAEEHRQFTYQPESSSPPVTDPFTETAQPQLRHEGDTQFYSSPPRVTQPPTSSAAIASARAAVSPPITTNGNHRPQQFYQQPDPQTTIHQPLSAIPTTAPPRPNTGQSSQRSYIPSTTGSSLGEQDEEYHINPDGSYTLDSRGRRIPYNQPIASDPEDVGDLDEEDDDDYASDIARERMYAQQYGNVPAHSAVTTSQPQQRQPAMPSIPQGQVSAPQSRPSAEEDAPDYEGSSFGPGWEGVTPRHQHPTRLSDIIEEQTSRTSPSRGSYLSGQGGPVAR